MQIPSDGSSIKIFLENELNNESPIEAFCSDRCKEDVRKMKRTKMANCDEVNFFIVVFSRGVGDTGANEFSSNRIHILDDVSIR